jgi:hypothetical protein
MADIILRGAALRAAVRAAETPGLGEVVKLNIASQLGLFELFELDLSEHDVEPAVLPHHPLPPNASTSDDE